MLNFIVAPQSKIKAIFLDFIGTCFDWHTFALLAMPSSVPKSEASKIAIDWYQQYFYENSQTLTHGLPPEDIDVTLARALSVVLDRNPEHEAHFDDAARKAWLRNGTSKPHGQMSKMR